MINYIINKKKLSKTCYFQVLYEFIRYTSTYAWWEKTLKENAIIKPLLVAGETDEIVSTSTEHMGAGLESLTKNHKAIVGKASPSLF